MASGLQSFHYHVADAATEDEGTRAPAFRGLRTEPPTDADVAVGFNSDEAAARFHLSSLLARDDRPAVRSVTAPERAELVPDLQLLDTQDLPQTGTRLVRFEQTHSTIPIFGSQAVIELNEDRGLVSADGEVGSVEGVSEIPSLTEEEAWAAIAKFLGLDVEELGAPKHPQLNYFRNPQGGEWHLTFYFEKVPAAPSELTEQIHGHGLGVSPREMRPLVDYLVDAHDGTVVYYFSATPLLDVPTKCWGFDEEGREIVFWGDQTNGKFRMRDPLREIYTHDIGGGDIDNAAIGDPVQNDTAKWGDKRKAAVSAHGNATRVYDFYKSVLLRDGIDNKGMALINVVNCTYAAHESPPDWHNAVWYDGRMWYGQATDASGNRVSYSRFLDVMAHELSHGLTEHTANLVYRDQSGALNESFSDIFGIIVLNWDPNQQEGGDVSTWSWELGPGLGQGGLPLRDLSDPKRTGDPDHMDDYLVTGQDAGGVHTNSNIHNKAANNLLTANDGGGSRIFTPREVAHLYYLCLTRLPRLATFTDTRRGLITVASTLYAGDEDERKTKVAAIEKAYDAVGIT